MPTAVRLDQTLTGSVAWPGSIPVGLIASVSDPAPATVQVNALTSNITLHPLAIGDVTVNLSAPNGAIAQDTVSITPAKPIVGTIGWNPPTPA